MPPKEHWVKNADPWAPPQRFRCGSLGLRPGHLEVVHPPSYLDASDGASPQQAFGSTAWRVPGQSVFSSYKVLL